MQKICIYIIYAINSRLICNLICILTLAIQNKTSVPFLHYSKEARQKKNLVSLAGVGVDPLSAKKYIFFHVGIFLAKKYIYIDMMGNAGDQIVSSARIASIQALDMIRVLDTNQPPAFPIIYLFFLKILLHNILKLPLTCNQDFCWDSKGITILYNYIFNVLYCFFSIIFSKTIHFHNNYTETI